MCTLASYKCIKVAGTFFLRTLYLKVHGTSSNFTSILPRYNIWDGCKRQSTFKDYNVAFQYLYFLQTEMSCMCPHHRLCWLTIVHCISEMIIELLLQLYVWLLKSWDVFCFCIFIVITQDVYLHRIAMTGMCRELICFVSNDLSELKLNRYKVKVG